MYFSVICFSTYTWKILVTACDCTFHIYRKPCQAQLRHYHQFCFLCCGVRNANSIFCDFYLRNYGVYGLLNIYIISSCLIAIQNKNIQVKLLR